MEEYVSREEFENLKKEVAEIKTELSKSMEILQKIDKKCDIISERLENSNKISDLQNEKIENNIISKLEPIKKDVFVMVLKKFLIILRNILKSVLI